MAGATLWARRRFVVGVTDEEVRANALLKLSLRQQRVKGTRGTLVGMRWDLLTSWLMAIESGWSGEVPLSDEVALAVRVRVIDCVRVAVEKE